MDDEFGLEDEDPEATEQVDADDLLNLMGNIEDVLSDLKAELGDPDIDGEEGEEFDPDQDFGDEDIDGEEFEDEDPEGDVPLEGEEEEDEDDEEDFK